MTFIVILFALLIERFFNWSHLRNWGWYVRYQHYIIKKWPMLAPAMQLAIIIIPMLLITLIVSILLTGWLYGLLTFLFELAIMIYCLGPRNLWADGYAQATTVSETSPLPEPTFLTHLFVDANHRVFAVIFWFVVLGPLGAVLYRTVALSSDTAQHDAPSTFTPVAGFLLNLLDWLPVRCFTFIFALGGHFANALSIWRKLALRGLASNHAMLVDCGLAALGSEADVAVEKSAISLIDRVFVIVLVIAAIGSLII